MNIKEIVNDPEWQSLRRSFVGTWKIFPERNCERLERYLGDFSDPLKLRRVLNYLTGSGFRSGKIKHPGITKLINPIKKVRNE
jgi:hypothetical protein